MKWKKGEILNSHEGSHIISYGTVNGNLPNIFRKAVSISLADGERATIARIQLCTMMLVIIHLKIGIFHGRLPEEPGPKKKKKIHIWT